jgi:ligand-binding sensor domain-containing protein
MPVAASLGNTSLGCSVAKYGQPREGLPSHRFYRRRRASVEHRPFDITDQRWFLWIGTHHGLLRYDGHHFTTFGFLPQELAGTSINTLSEASDGSLWVGTASGVAHIKPSALKQLGPASPDMYHPGSGEKDHVECLQIAADGTVWVGTDDGLFRFEGGAFICVIPDLWISRIHVTSGGHLLIVTSIGVREWDGQRIVDRSDLSRQLGVALNGVFDVFEDGGGTTWYCTAAGIARQKPHGGIERLQGGVRRRCWPCRQDRPEARRPN